MNYTEYYKGHKIEKFSGELVYSINGIKTTNIMLKSVHDHIDKLTELHDKFKKSF